MNTEIYRPGETILIEELKQIVRSARSKVYAAINQTMVEAYWQIGKRIVEEEQNGKERADYGTKLLKTLSAELTAEFGKGFSTNSLYYFRQFYLCFPKKLPTSWGILTWSHYKRLLSVVKPEARNWYLKENFLSITKRIKPTSMKHTLPFLIVLLLMAGCQSSNKERKSSFPEIRVNQTPDEKEITLQEIAEEISYIPLETNDTMLLRGVFLSICNEGIAVMHQVDGQVFLFDGKGKAKGSISRKGGGPEEYVGMQQAVVDWKRNELFVLDYKPHVKVYDLNGNYKRTLPMPIKVRDREMYSYSDSHLVLFKEVPDTEIGQADRVFAPYQPIILLDKTTGETTTLPYTKTSNMSIRLSSGWVNNNAIYASGKNVYLSDVSSDTIYQLHPSTHKVEPIMVRIPSLNSMDGEQFLLNLEGTTNRYGFFRRTNKDIKGKAAQHIQEWMYGYQTRETFLPVFKNEDYPSRKLDAHHLIHCHGEDNCLYVKLEAYELIEALENDELSGELQSIAKRLAEDDNPVLMKVKLK